jgi:hypothetical protein
VLLQSADDIETPGIDQYTGYGRLDVAKALAADPAYFIEALISSVEVVALDGKPNLRVNGTVDSNQLKSAWIEIGQGETPTSWKRVSGGIDQVVRGGSLADIDATLFAGATQWTLRLVVDHADGSRREARFLLNLG